MWCVAIFLIGISSTLTGINFLVTIVKMRAPGMTFTRMPLFVWASARDRRCSTWSRRPHLRPRCSRSSSNANSASRSTIRPRAARPLLWQHMFWFYSHPAVYIMILPAFGIVSEVLADVLAQADLRLQDDRVLVDRDRAARLHGLGAPHVHLRHGAVAAAALHDHHDGDRGADRHQDLLVDGDAVGRQDRVSPGDALCDRLS